MRRLSPVPSLFLVLALGACAKPPVAAEAEAAMPAQADPGAPADPALAQAPRPRVTGGPAPVSVVADEAEQASFNGYGDLVLGSSEAQARAAWGGELHGAPAVGSNCHYLLPKWVGDRRELGFMIEDGRFVRYDVGSPKQVAPGGGKVGMSLAELTALYHGALHAAPHKYIEGGQVLSLEASVVTPAKLVFEIDAAGKTIGWRVGLEPQVDYVEGCS